MIRRTLMALFLLLALPGAPARAAGDSLATAPSEPPRAPKRPVVDTYWGTPVEDDYQYLEQVSDP